MQNRQEMSFGEYVKHYLFYLVKWGFMAAVIGLICGLVGALFYRGVAAAVGLVAMFAGVTNTVIASVFLAIEVFSGSCTPRQGRST